MAVRNDISVNFTLVPRIITVAAPSTTLTIQDLGDTLRSIEDDQWNLQYSSLLSGAGKEELGGGLQVGITMELKNAQVSFAPRSTPTTTGTITATSTAGTVLTDGSATFVTDGVARGYFVSNNTDGSHATVQVVDSETQLTVDGLAGGTDNQFQSGDAYGVFPTVRCEITGGNLVAVAQSGTALDAVFQSFGTQVNYRASTSAALLNNTLTSAEVITIASSVATSHDYEGDESLQDMMRLMRAVLLGITTDSGRKFRDKADTKDRVDATTNANRERTAITTDPT